MSHLILNFAPAGQESWLWPLLSIWEISHQQQLFLWGKQIQLYFMMWYRILARLLYRCGTVLSFPSAHPHFIESIHTSPPLLIPSLCVAQLNLCPLPSCWPPRWSAVNPPPSPPSLHSSSSSPCSSSFSEADCWSRLAAPRRLTEVRK